MKHNGLMEAESCSFSHEWRFHRIVWCATETFLLNGYAGTSVEDVAILASVSKPTIYKLVGDKYELAKVVLETMSDSLADECSRAIDHDIPMEECLLRFAMAYIGWMNGRVGKAHHFGCLRLLIEMSSQHPEIPEMWVELSRKGVSGTLCNYIEKRVALGEFINEDPLFIASQFIRTIYYTGEAIMAKKLYVTDVEQTRRKIAMFLSGTRSEPNNAERPYPGSAQIN